MGETRAEERSKGDRGGRRKGLRGRRLTPPPKKKKKVDMVRRKYNRKRDDKENGMWVVGRSLSCRVCVCVCRVSE